MASEGNVCEAEIYIDRLRTQGWKKRWKKKKKKDWEERGKLQFSLYSNEKGKNISEIKTPEKVRKN